MLNSADEENKERTGLRPLVFYIVVVIIFVSDQFTKNWIVRTMSFGEYRQVIGRAFMITLTKNPGGAWGIGQSGNGVFACFAIVAIFALIYAYHRLARTDLLVGSAFALALGGALGNLTDRLRLGYVVDFFDARIINWPIFNVADSAISIGIVLLIWHYAMTIIVDMRSAGKESTTSVSPVAEGPILNSGIPTPDTQHPTPFQSNETVEDINTGTGLK